MPEIKIDNLTVNFKNKKEFVTPLNELSVTFESEKFSSVVGFSGCGKTTLLRSIAGLIDYEGDISFDGINGNMLSISERNLSYVSQQYDLYPHLTIFDNIAFPLKVMKAGREEIIERVYEVSKQLDLMPLLSRKPKQLSGGQQQRVAIARALVKRPQIILFDEPFSNLDEQIRREARYFLKKVVTNQSITIVYVTHDFKEATALSDTIYVLNNGKIEVSGSPRELLESNNEVVISLRNDGEVKDAI